MCVSSTNNSRFGELCVVLQAKHPSTKRVKKYLVWRLKRQTEQKMCVTQWQQHSESQRQRGRGLGWIVASGLEEAQGVGFTGNQTELPWSLEKSSFKFTDTAAATLCIHFHHSCIQSFYTYKMKLLICTSASTWRLKSFNILCVEIRWPRGQITVVFL